MSEVEADFKPNPETLQVLLSMGIPETVAQEALFCTGNDSPDAAINYIFSNSSNGTKVADTGERLASDKNQPGVVGENDDDEWEDEDAPYYKMIFVVNNSLKMGIGKIAAQVGHACLGLYRDMLESSMEGDLTQWEEIGEKKIVLKGNSTEHLMELYDKAKEANIPAYLVRDAGHTQIPRGSVTVLSLFGLEDNIDKITGKLSLL